MEDKYIPTGYRFYPSERELLLDFLKNKIKGIPCDYEAISEIDLYKFEPQDLLEMSRLKRLDRICYFFSALNNKYLKGKKINRSTNSGYWRATGKCKNIGIGKRLLGRRQTFIYYTGKPKKSSRTDFVMHQYKLDDKELGVGGDIQNHIVLCKIYQKSGRGPKNGEEYWAPFESEADYDIDEGNHSDTNDKAHGSLDPSTSISFIPFPAAPSFSATTENASNLVHPLPQSAVMALDFDSSAELDDTGDPWKWITNNGAPFMETGNGNGSLNPCTAGSPVQVASVYSSALTGNVSDLARPVPQLQNTGASGCPPEEDDMHQLLIDFMDSLGSACASIESAAALSFTQQTAAPVLSGCHPHTSEYYTKKSVLGDQNKDLDAYACCGSFINQNLVSNAVHESTANEHSKHPEQRTPGYTHVDLTGVLPEGWDPEIWDDILITSDLMSDLNVQPLASVWGASDFPCAANDAPLLSHPSAMETSINKYGTNGLEYNRMHFQQ